MSLGSAGAACLCHPPPQATKKPAYFYTGSQVLRLWMAETDRGPAAPPIGRCKYGPFILAILIAKLDLAPIFQPRQQLLKLHRPGKIETLALIAA